MLSIKATNTWLYSLMYTIEMLAALPVLAYPAGISVGGGVMMFRFLVSPLLLLLVGVGFLAQRSWAHRGNGLLLLLLDAYWVFTLYRELSDGI